MQGCRDLGSDSFSIAADVSQADAVERMFQMVRSRYGGLDVLINNAGIDGPPNLVWDANRSDWLRVLEVNLCGAFYCMQQALADMIARRSGVIINVTSVHETMPWKGFSAYAAAKAGLSMLSKTAALEAAPHGVRILAVAPGVVQTTDEREPLGKTEVARPTSRKNSTTSDGATRRDRHVGGLARFGCGALSDWINRLRGRRSYPILLGSKQHSDALTRALSSMRRRNASATAWLTTMCPSSCWPTRSAGMVTAISACVQRRLILLPHSAITRALRRCATATARSDVGRVAGSRNCNDHVVRFAAALRASRRRCGRIAYRC